MIKYILLLFCFACLAFFNRVVSGVTLRDSEQFLQPSNVVDRFDESESKGMAFLQGPGDEADKRQMEVVEQDITEGLKALKEHGHLEGDPSEVKKILLEMGKQIADLKGFRLAKNALGLCERLHRNKRYQKTKPPPKWVETQKAVKDALDYHATLLASSANS